MLGTVPRQKKEKKKHCREMNMNGSNAPVCIKFPRRLNGFS